MCRWSDSAKDIYIGLCDGILIMRLMSLLSVYTAIIRLRIVRFLAVGVSAVALHLLVTYLLTTFVFGLQGYFYGYSIGLILTLCYNYVLHSVYTFERQKMNTSRFFLFIAVTLTISLLQAATVKIVTPLVGLEWYLVSIFFVVISYSALTFLFLKFWLFRT